MLPELLFALKFVGLALLIVQCGRSVLNHLLADDARHLDLTAGEYSYMAIPFGVAVTFVLATILRSFGAYRWLPMVCGLGVIAAVAAGTSLYRKRRPAARRGSAWLALYGLTVLAIVLSIAPETYPNQRGTATYVLQGFDLFDDKDASAWPYFGEEVRMPMMYVTHAIGVAFNLFSHGSPYRFYLDGLYWANVLLAPLVPIGAYLFFRRKLPWIAAALVSAAFCFMILGLRTWSVRGETLGWLVALAFLIGFGRLIEHFATPASSRATWRIAICLAVLYFTTALTHGISAFVSTAIAVGLVAHHFVASRRQSDMTLRKLMKVTAVFVGTLLVLSASYMYSFGSVDLPAASMNAGNTRMPVGEPDAAVMFENALLYPGRSIAPATHAAAPYLPPSTAAQLTAFIPLAALFRPEVEDVALANFPQNAVADLATIPVLERAAYVLILTLSGVMLWRHRRQVSDAAAQLFVVSVTVYLATIVLTLYLNAQSTSVFPLAATRRLYQYVRFFFCMAVLASAFGLAARPLARTLDDRMRWSWSIRASAAVRATFLGILLPGAILYSICTTSSFAFISGGWLRGAPERRALFEAVQRGDADVMRTKMPPVYGDPVLSLPNLFAAVEAVKARTHPGEYVYVNIVSDNQFWYLSQGRVSLLEGSAMYQVYAVQGPAAERINRFRQFGTTADLRSLGDQKVRLVLLYKHDGCFTPACYGFTTVPVRLEAFRQNAQFDRVFENDEFVLWQVNDASAKEHGAQPLPAS